ncbi:MAG TPA: hypothetical protein VF418_06860 [Sphingomonadaceae bacterium]
MGDDSEDEEIEFASPPCSLSELSPEFAGLAPQKPENKPKRKKAKRIVKSSSR